jgi:hypothetical protein
MKFTFVQQTNLLQKGALYMAREPNIYELPPTTASQMSQYRGCVSGALRENITLTVPCSDLPTLFVREDYARINEDLKTYDLGKLIIASDGADPIGVVGHLWIEYDIDLFEAQSSMLTAAPLIGQTFRRQNNALQVYPLIYTNVIFDLLGPVGVPDPPLMGPIQTSADAFTLNRANYEINIECEVYNNGGVVSTFEVALFSSRSSYLVTRDLSIEPGKIQIVSFNYRLAAQKGDIITFPAYSSNGACETGNGAVTVSIRPA